MDSAENRRHSSSGLPHSGIPGSRPACGSPRLIAACHALHRHLMPRHPPYTLNTLTTFALDTHGLMLAYSIVKERISSDHSSEETGGAERARTADPLLAKQALSQLSYSPFLRDKPSKPGVTIRATPFLVGLDRVELSTSRLSGVRSNQLSYRPSLCSRLSSKKCNEMATLVVLS